MYSSVEFGLREGSRIESRGMVDCSLRYAGKLMEIGSYDLRWQQYLLDCDTNLIHHEAKL